MKDKLVDLDAAVDLVESGDTLTFSGVSMVRKPMAFIAKLIQSGKKDFTIIDREPGMDFDILIAAGCVKCARAAMVGFELFGLAPNVRRAVQEGEIQFIEETCGAVVNGLRAGAMGLPFLPVKGIIGTDLVELHEKLGNWKIINDPFGGGEIVAVKAIVPDVAVIHVQKADRHGNASLEGSRFEDVYKAKAAKNLIITAEEIVPTDYFKENPERNTIPYCYTTAVVHVPKGAYPTACPNYYPPDYEEVLRYLKMCREGKVKEYIDEFIKRW